MQAGLLARNIFAVLPIPPGTVDSGVAKTITLLTVAGQLVIHTQFPINPEINRGPSPFDERM